MRDKSFVSIQIALVCFSSDNILILVDCSNKTSDLLFTTLTNFSFHNRPSLTTTKPSANMQQLAVLRIGPVCTSSCIIFISLVSLVGLRGFLRVGVHHTLLFLADLGTVDGVLLWVRRAASATPVTSLAAMALTAVSIAPRFQNTRVIHLQPRPFPPLQGRSRPVSPHSGLAIS